MNRRIWLLSVLGTSLAWGQANPGASSAPSPTISVNDQKPSIVSTAKVPMDAPVLTLKGFCPGRNPASKVGPSSSCQTVITRAQFEKITAAIRPNTLSASVKQQLASLYPRLLVMSGIAEEQGLDKQAPYDEMILFSRMQILSQGLTRKLQEESANISDDEVADYYQKNPEVFNEYTLERLIVPLRKPSVASEIAESRKAANDNDQARSGPIKESAEEVASERDLGELAQSLQARAAAGEDFMKLQQLAFESAGSKVTSPTTRMDKVRRSMLPADQSTIFELKVGEVSQVITDPGGHYIYKLEAKGRLTMEQAKSEISDTLKSQRMKQAMDKIQGSYTTETNDAYFAVPAKNER
jgi:hypothetical protein